MTEQQPAGTPEGQPAPEAKPEPDKSFTQADVDRIVSDRLKRERDKIGDVEDLRKKAARLDEIEAANKSELEKAADRIAQAEKRAEVAEARAKSTLVEKAITSAAAKANFIDPDDAYRFIDAEDIEFDGDEPKNVDKLLKTLASSKPHLVSQSTGSGSADQGPRGASTTTSDPGEEFGRLIASELRR